MRAHPYADRFPMLGTEELERLAADELLGLSGGTPSKYLQVSIWRDDDHTDYFHVSAFSGGANSYTKRPVKPEFVSSQLRVLVDDLGAQGVEVEHVRVSRRASGSERSQNVYFVRDALGNIKIGYATHVDSRVQALQTANSMPLVLLGSMPGTLSDEKALHARFADAHMRGEWFAPTPELLSFIAAHTYNSKKPGAVTPGQNI